MVPLPSGGIFRTDVKTPQPQSNAGGGRDAVFRVQALYRTTVIFWVFVVPPACRRRK